ncbi:hypothetical protein F511_22424 [Dorcoceras hygrometricum]|uniref:Uncharacterized protein n=1 Tax=Dorcoceras hygrometricum TaxID=472368 RepID=A0A2Z7B7C9_9LAMI|nr:hypothetical protein F511_22424 [Dorcoceras hygrometricum]
MLFTRDDIPLDATTDDQTSIPTVSTDLSATLADLQAINPSTLMHLKVAFSPSYIKLNKAFVTPCGSKKKPSKPWFRVHAKRA